MLFVTLAEANLSLFGVFQNMFNPLFAFARRFRFPVGLKLTPRVA